MNAELNRQTHYEAARLYMTQLARNLREHRKWIHCPKCIGGNMFREISGEYTCLQCGYNYYPETVTESSKLDKYCPGEVENLQSEFHLATSK